MAADRKAVHVSLTEVPHFGRLVEFLGEVEALGTERDDRQLLCLVDECREDLQGFCNDGWRR